MSRDASERLRDILDALTTIREHVGGSLEAPSIANQLVLDAVLFRLLVIGEAAKNVDEELQGAAPDVPWRDYAGLRDIIAHQYFRIQQRIIEDTVRRDLPSLETAVEKLLDDA
jgi:uncharacterized protein with HEPN domain